jgi:hypothetical protein
MPVVNASGHRDHCLSSICDSQRLPNRLKARFLNRQNTISTAIYGLLVV